VPVDRFVPGLDRMLDRAAADPRLLPKAGMGQRSGWALQRIGRRLRALFGPGGTQR
jgi:hypothetical protein